MKDYNKFKSMLEKFQTTEYTNEQLRKICNALLLTLISSQKAHDETFELLEKLYKERNSKIENI